MGPSWSSSRAIPVLLVTLLVTLMAADAGVAGQEPDVRYDPSPPAVVRAMLEIAGVGRDDVFYDLGSGDGRIVIAAARDFGVTRATGVEIDAELLAEARRNAGRAGVAERVRFVQADLFDYDFSDASVVTLFLLPRLNIRLRPRLLSELEPGTRVVSHEHDMDAWEPDDHVVVDGHHVYLWIVPARVEGRWTWRADGRRYRLALQQRFQGVAGTLTEDGGRARMIREPALRGERLRFTVPPGDDPGSPRLRFEGRIDGGTLEGTLHRGDERIAVHARRAG